MLAVQEVSKHFGATIVNDAVSFHIEKGEVFGLLGPNGAGKTTLVSQIIGFMKPTTGSITIDQADVVKRPHIARELCTFQPQEKISLSGLTPRQAIELTGFMRGAKKRDVKRNTTRLIRALKLEQWEHTRAERLSGGIRRLVTFCMATVVPGKLVILDEPTNDVDPIRRKLLWDEVRSLARKGVAVLLITHNVLEAELSVDRLAIMHQGKLIRIGAPAEMKQHNRDVMHVELHFTKRAPISFPIEMTILSEKPFRTIASFSTQDQQHVMEWLLSLQRKSEIEEFTLRRGTLEEAYACIVQNEQKTERNERIAAR